MVAVKMASLVIKLICIGLSTTSGEVLAFGRLLLEVSAYKSSKFYVDLVESGATIDQQVDYQCFSPMHHHCASVGHSTVQGPLS